MALAQSGFFICYQHVFPRPRLLPRTKGRTVPVTTRQRLGLRQFSAALRSTQARAGAPEDWRTPGPRGISKCDLHDNRGSCVACNFITSRFPTRPVEATADRAALIL